MFKHFKLLEPFSNLKYSHRQHVGEISVTCRLVLYQDTLVYSAFDAYMLHTLQQRPAHSPATPHDAWCSVNSTSCPRPCNAHVSALATFQFHTKVTCRSKDELPLRLSECVLPWNVLFVLQNTSISFCQPASAEIQWGAYSGQWALTELGEDPRKGDKEVVEGDSGGEDDHPTSQNHAYATDCVHRIKERLQVT